MKDIGKNIYKRKRCFILATGPSLKGQDLSWLKDEITIGINEVYLTENLNFTPTFMCISDIHLWKYSQEKLSKMDTTIIGCFPNPSKIKSEYTGKNLGIVFKNFGRTPDPIFSWNLERGVHSTRSVVTTVALPFVCWSGFSLAYLLGCDCTGDGHSYDNGMTGTRQSFAPFIMRAFHVISKMELPIKIYNATEGGYLEYFKRVNLDDLRR